jgi:hypothetical protein
MMNTKQLHYAHEKSHTGGFRKIIKFDNCLTYSLTLMNDDDRNENKKRSNRKLKAA